MYNPQTQGLFDYLEDTQGADDEAIVVFASRSAARRCQDFVERTLADITITDAAPVPVHTRLIDVAPVEQLGASLTGVAVDVAHEGLLKAYWQHCGEIISSRTAAAR